MSDFKIILFLRFDLVSACIVIFSSRGEYFEIFSLIGASSNIDLKVYRLVIDTVDEQEPRFEDSLIATICRHPK